MCALTGKNPTDAYLDAMMNEAPGPINFTMFLTMFGEKLNGTDPEDVIRNAFACFDEEATGNAALVCIRPTSPYSTGSIFWDIFSMCVGFFLFVCLFCVFFCCFFFCLFGLKPN